MSADGRRNPQHFHRPCTGLVPFYTSDPHAYAHTADSPAAALAAGSRPARRDLRDPPGTPDARTGVDEIVPERRAPMAAAALPDNRLTYSPPAGRPHPGRLRVRSPLTRHHGLRQTPRSDPARARLPTRQACTLAAFALACLRSRRSRSRTPPVFGHDRGSSRWRIPGGRRRAVPAPVLVLGIAFRPGRIRHGPSMYEMEGPCPASPHRLASCLVFAARRAPRAGARYPREGPVSRLLPRSRGRPRVVPVSSGESIITTAASTAQDPAASHFLFFRYPRKAPQRAGSYPHSTAVIHGLFTTYPQVPECQPENTTTAGAECPVLCNQIAGLRPTPMGVPVHG